MRRQRALRLVCRVVACGAVLILCGSAHGGLVVQVDFNDEEGNLSWVNTGSAGGTGSVINVEESETVPFVNTGGRSAKFIDGGTNAVVLGDIDALDGLTALTVATWIRMTGSKGGRVISKGYDAWEMSIDSSARPTFTVEFSTVYSGTSIGDTWSFFAVTYDGSISADNVVFYMGDGLTVSPVRTQTLDKASITAVSRGVWLGDSSGHNGDRPFSGWLDNVKIYDEILDAAALAAIMIEDDAPAASEQAPLVALDLNDVDGVPSLVNRGFVPLTGAFNGPNAGYASDVPGVNAPPPAGQSAQFAYLANDTASRSYCTLGNPRELSGLSHLSLCLWAKATGVQSNGLVRLVAKGFDLEFALSSSHPTLLNATPKLQIDNQTVGNTSSPITNEWVFLAVTFDGLQATDNVVFYAGDGSDLSVLATNTVSSRELPGNGSPLYVGDWNGAAGSRGFTGLIDGVRLYERILGVDELRAVMMTDDAPSPRGTTITIR